MKPLKYENEKYEILIENHVFIKDKIKNNYYRNKLSAIDSEELKHFTSYPEKISNFLFWIYILLTITMIIVNNIYTLYLQKNIKPLFDINIIIILVLYFLFNIFMHELGHIYSLKFFGRQFNKVGFKLNFYVFPSFYVQMNEIYMLSKKDKIIVHSFGLFINFLFINSIQLFNVVTIDNYGLTLAYLFFSSTMIWNLIPILNSDGYKIMLTALSLDEFEKIMRNHWLVIIFQFVGVVIALNTLIHWLIHWSKYFYP
ncbi:peptidase [Staphylococcus hominis]|uniref:peptidase n=1 Tax=Staphylococcus hominis TaxID=1290 RepID=UPI001F5A7EF3|nr:peptidase [Staphylococcus hominis]MCI2928410.1 peptidase [Staphylococcus hominis]MDS3852984.1 peptidase [Staphylococcus hominis]